MFSGFRRTPGATPMQPRSSSESASGSTRALFACRGALSRGSLTRGRHPTGAWKPTMSIERGSN